MTVDKEGGFKRKRLSTIKTMLDQGLQGLSTHRRAGGNGGDKKSSKKKRKRNPIDDAKIKQSPRKKSAYNDKAIVAHRQKQQHQHGPMIRQKYCSKVGNADSSGKETGDQKKKKKKKKTKPPQERIICVAEEALIACIGQKRSSGAAIHADDLSDLPKDAINALPDVPYKKTKNPVIVVSSASSSDRAVAEIRAELSIHQRGENGGNGVCQSNSVHFLGFDTETKPKFHQGGDNHPPALIQLATQTTAYLFRLKIQGTDQKGDGAMTESLQSLLCDPSIVKVGIGIRKDVVDLKHVYGARCCGDGTSFLDLGPLATLRWPNIKRAGLRNLTATVLRRKLSKAQQMKNWEIKQLTPAMQAYAAADAFVSLDLLAAIVG